MKRILKKLLCLIILICYIFSNNVMFVHADTARLYGDLNQNGMISAKDAFMTLLYTAKEYDLSEEQLIIADINNDGQVNAKDAYLILLCAAGVQTSFRADEFKSNGTIWIAADSIAEGGSSYVGWGQVIGKYLKSGATVNNTALSGSTARFFLRTDNYKRIMDEMQPGDTLFIAFGHNDSFGDSDPYGDSSTEGNYKYYLKYKYIEPTLRRGAMPILMTSVARCRNIGMGPEYQYHWLYIKAAKELVEEYKEIGIEIPFIDMFNITFTEYTYLGTSVARNKFHTDEIHYKQAGAEFAAQLILLSIYEKGWDFSRFIDMDKVEDPRIGPHD